ncbi:hypothetical protein J1N35_008107 [Gossypium stocksii]|uniref:Uncharacterized protein n=1 Tax=Gossypium stocksii TaxID=47602 RepID=A0A9D3W752_9ROSI|nr:hypothetical protein J1N35_008107 [Gossypium stocksii]
MVESDTKSGQLESLHNVHSFDSEGNNSPKFNTRIDMGNPDLKTGMVFANRENMEGLRDGCKPITSLDGCFLKGYYGGHLLSAVGIDANDCIYPTPLHMQQ